MNTKNGSLYLTIMVSALGYLVDVYDIMIFTAVRVPSLVDIGIPQSELLQTGLSILNWQLVGMLLGGLFWGVIGDRKGRLTVLFGSIFLYSTASLLNVFVTTSSQYIALRFIAGFGLAGELGAGVTLVSELLPIRWRGYGTMLIASIGVIGGILAGLMGQYAHWKTCYLLGGILGLSLLFIRVQVVESGIFQKLSPHKLRQGDLTHLLFNAKLLKRYLACLFLAVPAWIVMGLFTTLAPEISYDINPSQTLTSASALFYMSLGLGLGDFSSSWLSQQLHSRKKILVLFISIMFFLTLVFSLGLIKTANSLLTLYFCFGLGAGYWAVFMMAVAEQFGTNLRATVTVSIPNFVRAMGVPLTFAIEFLRGKIGLNPTMSILLFAMSAIALFSVKSLNETFHKDLDFVS